jgi:hypothetical protein
MASFVEKFRNIGAQEYKKCSELILGMKYPIETLQNTDTKYGNSVLATVQDHEDKSRKFRIYLPHRYANVFTDEELRCVTPSTLHLVYRGKREQTTLVEITQ